MTATLSLPLRRVLVVEDEQLVARDMSFELESLGASVLGPAATVAAALDLVDGCGAIDAAVLDIRLGGELVYPVARRLQLRGVPFVFYTGFESVVPDDLAGRPCIQKPASSADVARSIEALFRRVRREAPTRALADVYLADDGQYLFRLRDTAVPGDSESLEWLGLADVDATAWGVRLRLTLQPGTFYCIPKRYVGMLRQDLQVLG